MNSDLILASSSPRRRELLTQVGINFQVVPSEFVEHAGLDWSPAQMVMANAMGKAHQVAQSQLHAVVLGADTIVVCQGRVLGKPQDRNDAGCMLRLLADGWHEVLTAIALVHAARGITRSDIVTTRVHMRPITDDELERYLDTGEPFDKAGAYGIQGMAGQFVDRIEGCYFNVVGLPLSRTTQLLREMLVTTG